VQEDTCILTCMCICIHAANSHFFVCRSARTFRPSGGGYFCSSHKASLFMHMLECKCVCVCVCVCVCTSLSVYVDRPEEAVCAYIHVRTHIHTHIRRHVRTYIDTCIHTQHTYTTYIHTYIHTYTHTHIYARDVNIHALCAKLRDKEFALRK
jgi:hypothetical protein